MSQEGVKAGGNQEAEGSKLRVSGHPSTAQTRRRDAVMEAGLSRGLSLNCGLLNIRRWAPVSRVRVRVWFASHLTVTSPVHASCRNASARQPRQPRCGGVFCVFCVQGQRGKNTGRLLRMSCTGLVQSELTKSPAHDEYKQQTRPPSSIQSPPPGCQLRKQASGIHPACFSRSRRRYVVLLLHPHPPILLRPSCLICPLRRHRKNIHR